MIEVKNVAALVTILTSADKTLNDARERAQASKDTDLKALINTLCDQMAAMKELIHRVQEDDAALRREVEAIRGSDAAKPKIRQVGDQNYYYVGEEGPYCQRCYDGKGKLVLLSPPKASSGGIYRSCVRCDRNFWEKPVKL